MMIHLDDAIVVTRIETLSNMLIKDAGRYNQTFETIYNVTVKVNVEKTEKEINLTFRTLNDGSHCDLYIWCSAYKHYNHLTQYPYNIDADYIVKLHAKVAATELLNEGGNKGERQILLS